MDIHIISFLVNSENLHFEEFLPTFACQIHQNLERESSWFAIAQHDEDKDEDDDE